MMETPDHTGSPVARKDREYDRAQRRALARLETGFDLSWAPPASRDELHR